MLLALCVVTACAAQTASVSPPILLFAVAGSSANDVAAVELLLRRGKSDYVKANSAQLNVMPDSALQSFRLIIVPGGNFITMGDSLSLATTVKVHDAVQGGVNYLGLCAGAFLAGRGTTYNSFNLTSGIRFKFYSIAGKGVRKAPVIVSTLDGRAIEHYWEDGPELSGWGDVVAKYPDGTPAVAQGMSGRGWVILTGTHPEAPQHWRRGLPFTTQAGDANAYAAMLIDAALNRTRLPHY